jgi:hypothetical protein
MSEEREKKKKRKNGENDLFLCHSKGIIPTHSPFPYLPSFHLSEKSLSQLILLQDG